MRQREIFRVEKLPVLQNRMFSGAFEALNSPTGDVVLVQDPATGLIFNTAFEPEKLEYNEEYQNEQACSGVFQGHLDAVTEVMHRYFRGRPLIEVGCGKGYFLEHLHRLGYDVTGVDPAYEGKNPRVVKARFQRELGLSADGVVLRHVLEHLPDAVEFLSDIAKANGGKGAIYIEVPCLDWIMQRRAWFDIYYEHVNYFRLHDFQRLFGTVLESGHVFSGQYLYVVAELSSLRTPHADKACAVDFPSDFLDDIHRLSAVAMESRCNAIWGGASKGVVFAIHMQRAGASFEMTIDINPAKQGKYLAGSGLRVMSPDEAKWLLQPGDNVFVMNSNYIDEIVAQSGARYRYHTVDHG